MLCFVSDYVRDGIATSKLYCILRIGSARCDRIGSEVKYDFPHSFFFFYFFASRLSLPLHIWSANLFRLLSAHRLCRCSTSEFSSIGDKGKSSRTTFNREKKSLIYWDGEMWNDKSVFHLSSCRSPTNRMNTRFFSDHANEWCRFTCILEYLCRDPPIELNIFQQTYEKIFRRFTSGSKREKWFFFPGACEYTK